MPVPDTSGVPPWADLDGIKGKINELVQKYNNLLVSLDDFNFNKITAKVLEVDQLSAIIADLGTITAGIIRGIEIYGSYIATSEGTYPRTEMDVSGDLLGAYAAVDKYIRIAALNGTTSSPALIFNEGSDTYLIYASPSTGELLILGTGDLSFGSAGSTIKLGEFTRVTNWSSLINNATSQTLQQALNDKANSFIGYTGIQTVVTGVDFTTETVTTADLHFTNGILSVVT